jgi:hypothetical protein
MLTSKRLARTEPVARCPARDRCRANIDYAALKAMAERQLVI